MGKYKVCVDTQTDGIKFMEIINKIPGNVYLLNQKNEDGSEYRVNAKSLIGITLALCEWPEKYVKCDSDAYTALKDFIEE